MAYTILQQPTGYSSAHDESWYLVDSTNKTNVGYKYVCDIYVGATLVARLKSFPFPDNALHGAFNVSNVLRNYINNYFSPYTNAYSFSTNSIFVEYQVRFGEEFGGTLYTNLVSYTDRVWNYAVDYLPNLFNAWTGDGLDYQANYEGALLTKRDINGFIVPNISLPSNYFISVLGIDDTNDYQVSFRHYTSGVWSSWLDINWSNGNDKLMVFNIAPYALNNSYGSAEITTNTTQYEVQLNYTSGTIINIPVFVACTNKYTPVVLHFLNSVGGYDSFTFTLVNRQTRTNESKSFEQVEWMPNISNTNIDRYNEQGVFNGGSKTFSTLQTLTYKLISDYVSLTDYYWLNDLIRSTDVYMGIGANKYMPVTIKTNNWIEKKQYTDKVYNLELDIEISAKTNSQYK